MLECKEYVTSICLGSDIIPRLSVRSLYAMREQVRTIVLDVLIYNYVCYFAHVDCLTPFHFIGIRCDCKSESKQDGYHASPI